MDCNPPGSSVHGDSPGKNTGVGFHALLQGDLPNPGIKPRSPALQEDSLPSEPPGTQFRQRSNFLQIILGEAHEHCKVGENFRAERNESLALDKWRWGWREGNPPGPSTWWAFSLSTLGSSVLSSQRRRWHPAPVLSPGKSHGWRSLVGYSPGGHWGLDMTEWLHFHFSLSCTGEGNGSPLQGSCLESPRDGGAWWAAIYGVAQNRTRLKWLSNSSSILSSTSGFSWVWKFKFSVMEECIWNDIHPQWPPGSI